MLIENTRPELALAAYHSMGAAELVAQQIGIRSAQHALEFLLRNGASEATAQSMLDGLKEQLFAVHEAATKRGIQLPGYQ